VNSKRAGGSRSSAGDVISPLLGPHDLDLLGFQHCPRQ
jgi:hypothetical protein